MNSITTPSQSTSAVDSAQPTARVYKPLQYREGAKNVTEFNYDLPKGEHSNLVGSYSYSVPSLKSGQLRAKVATQKLKLQRLQAKENISGRRAPKKKNALRCSIKYLENELAREVARCPVIKVNVHEIDRDQSSANSPANASLPEV